MRTISIGKDSTLLLAKKIMRRLAGDILFTASNFKHLLGLHKLTDLPDICNTKSTILYHRIINNEISEDYLSKSIFFKDIEDRLNNFCYILDVLYSPTIIIRSYTDKFNTIVAEMLFFKSKTETIRLHLFLKDNESVYVPVTFFPSDDTSYLNKGQRWKMIDIIESSKLSELAERT